MSLRNRIALTCVLLLGIAVGAALYAVSAANEKNAEREIQRQFGVGLVALEHVLDDNQRQLNQAAQVLAADFGLREAVATHDAATIGSTLENHAARLGAALVELVSLDGRVLATVGAQSDVGEPFARRDLLVAGATDSRTTVAVKDGRIYQIVAVPVRAPLPVAWIVMGFLLDGTPVQELSKVTGLDVTFAFREAGSWHAAASSLAPAGVPAALGALSSPAAPAARDLIVRTLPLATGAGPVATAVLTRSLAEVRAPFDRLRERIEMIAVACLTLTTLAAFWLARNITQPLRALTRAIDGIRAGEYDAPIANQRHDELGTLAEGLQLMQQAVASRDRHIRALAYTDRLTGLMNRAAFADALTAAIDGATDPVAVAVINIRRFRRINEILGYEVGDAVLRQVGANLAQPPRLAVQFARVGADQFAALTPLGPGASPEYWGRQLTERVSRAVTVLDQPIDISTSIGIAVGPADANSADELLRCADLAVGRARSAKLPLQVYDEKLGGATREQLSLVGELQRAIDRNEFVLALQPKIDLRTEAVVGAEALMRWRHPARGLLMPGAFIPFAEQAGIIQRLTRWTLREGIRIASEWSRHGEPLSISLNMSAEDLVDPRFDSDLAQLLNEYALPSQLLTLELTESGLITEPDKALTRLHLLKRLGVKLSIDDFGTGYSSLAYLARMPVDELKIDRSFVTALADSSQAAVVVRAAIEMGHNLGLAVVAEGIEDHDVARQLAGLGCDVAQGYLYSKPLLLDDFMAWRAARARPAAERFFDGTTTTVRRLHRVPT